MTTKAETFWHRPAITPLDIGVSSQSTVDYETLACQRSGFVKRKTHMNIRAALAISLVALGGHAYADNDNVNDKVHILSAVFGNPQAKKTCVPNLGICEGVAQCEVDVDDSLCKVPEGAGATVLLVTFQCGKGPNKNVAAYFGQKLTLIKCP